MVYCLDFFHRFYLYYDTVFNNNIQSKICR